jgi:hypothetical protein
VPGMTRRQPTCSRAPSRSISSTTLPRAGAGGPCLAAELESGAADAELRSRQEQLDVVLFPGARGLPGSYGVAAGTGFDGDGGVGRVGARG